MVSRLLPERIDNTYTGSRIALVLFGVLVLLKCVMGFNSTFFGSMVAGDADGIPLASYPAACAQTIVSMYGSWGIALFTICALCVLALIRYRAMVPLMFVALLFEQVARNFADRLHPIATVTSAGGTINLVLDVALLVGLLLSVWVPWRRAEPPSA